MTERPKAVVDPVLVGVLRDALLDENDCRCGACADRAERAAKTALRALVENAEAIDHLATAYANAAFKDDADGFSSADIAHYREIAKGRLRAALGGAE